MKALILTGRLVQDQEFIYPFHRLQEAGYEVDVATKNKETVLGYFGTKIIPNIPIPHFQIGEFDYDLLVLPGGVKCMEHMRLDRIVISAIGLFHAKGKVIASICSAAQLLISAKIVKDNVISGYYAMRDDIINAGAAYSDAPYVISNKIVTSPHYKHLGPWMKAVLEEVEKWKQ